MQSSRCTQCGDWRTHTLTKENSVFVWEELPGKKHYVIIMCIACKYGEIKEIEDEE